MIRICSAGEPNLLPTGGSGAATSDTFVVDEGTGWSPTHLEKDSMNLVLLHWLHASKLE